MLAGLRPELHPEPHGISLQPAPVDGAFACIAEAEGLTVIAPLSVLPADPAWARISLALHSDLAAVGLTAALSGALARHGISANVIAGFHHDHILVPWGRRDDAMRVLQDLSRHA